MPRVRNTVDIQPRFRFPIETSKECKAMLVYSRSSEREVPCRQCSSGEAATFAKCITVTLVDGVKLWDGECTNCFMNLQEGNCTYQGKSVHHDQTCSWRLTTTGSPSQTETTYSTAQRHIWIPRQLRRSWIHQQAKTEQPNVNRQQL